MLNLNINSISLYNASTIEAEPDDGTLIKQKKEKEHVILISFDSGYKPLFHYPILLLILNAHNEKPQLQPTKNIHNCTSSATFIQWGTFRV